MSIRGEGGGNGGAGRGGGGGSWKILLLWSDEHGGKPIDAAKDVEVAAVFGGVGVQFEVLPAFDGEGEFIGRLEEGGAQVGFLPEDFSVEEDGYVGFTARGCGIVHGDAELQCFKRAIEVIGKDAAGVNAKPARINNFAHGKRMAECGFIDARRPMRAHESGLLVFGGIDLGERNDAAAEDFDRQHRVGENFVLFPGGIVEREVVDGPGEGMLRWIERNGERLFRKRKSRERKAEERCGAD